METLMTLIAITLVILFQIIMEPLDDEFGTRYCGNGANDSDEKSRNSTLNRASSINIYRYKFTQEFMDEIYQFAKIHQYDERKDFKEAWEVWMETQSELINSEVNRLTAVELSR